MQVEASPKNSGKKYLRKRVTVQGSELGLHRDTDRRQKTPNKTMFKKSWQREDPQGAHSCQAAGIKSFQTTRKYREGHPPLGSNATVIANETIICRFCVCKCAYSLKFIFNSKSIFLALRGHSQSRAEWWKTGSPNMHVLLFLRLLSYTNKRPFAVYLMPCFLQSFVFLFFPWIFFFFFFW